VSYKDGYEYRQARRNEYARRMVSDQLKAMPGSDICWKCGKKIDMTIKDHNDPMAWTMDHVQSLANGGSHTLQNARPAHRSCNSARGRALQNQRASRDW